MSKKIAIINFFLDEKQQQKGLKGYHFFTLMDDLEEGDLVVVRTVNGLRIASFSEYITASDYANSYIIVKIDEKQIQETVAKEEEIKQIEKEMEVRMQEVKRMAEYKEVAASDDKMKSLLEKKAELEK